MPDAGQENQYELVNLINGLNISMHITRLVGGGNACFHWHKEVELAVPMGGPIMLYRDTENVMLGQYDICVVNANEAHCMQKTGESGDVLTVQIPINFCRDYYPAFSSLKFTDRRIRYDMANKEYVTLFRHLIDVMEDLHTKQEGYELRVVGLANLIVYNLISNVKHDAAGGEKHPADSRNMKRINRIINTIQENYTYKITLADLAQQEGLDIYYMSHFIKKHLNMTFQQYVNKLRLSKAVELLLKTDKKRVDICMESGFSDYRYLCKAFEEEYHCTPLQFREKYRDANGLPEKGAEAADDGYVIMNEEQSYELFTKHLGDKKETFLQCNCNCRG